MACYCNIFWLLQYEVEIGIFEIKAFFKGNFETTHYSWINRKILFALHVHIFEHHLNIIYDGRKVTWKEFAIGIALKIWTFTCKVVLFNYIYHLFQSELFCAKIEQSLGNSFQSNSKLHMVLFFLSSKLLLENKMVNTHENSSWQKKSWTNFEHVSLVLSNSLEIHQCCQLCQFHGSILETDILNFTFLAQ